MRIAQAVFSLVPSHPLNWRADWAWGLPLIVLTVVIHVLGLGMMSRRALRLSSHTNAHRHPTAVFALIMGLTSLLATGLHALETGIWGAAYRVLDALPNARSAMLYSLDAMTSYGHTSLALQDHWQLMGAIEALNGWLLFGLTTAFLFDMIQKVSALTGRDTAGGL